MNNTTPKMTNRPGSQPQRWQGVGFLLHGLHYVVATDAISEIIPIPKTTALPNASPWIKGIANINGRLVAVVSLGTFISGVEQNSPEARVLLIPHHEVTIGLVVEQVTGIKQFTRDHYTEQVPVSVPHNMQPFTGGSYDSRHIVFSVTGFLGSEQFLTADAGF